MSWYFLDAFLSILLLPVLLPGLRERGSLSDEQKASKIRSLPVCCGVRSTLWSNIKIVVHGAWYLNEQVIGRSGMLGRSQGCFAVADSSLPEIMARLGPGRLIYADDDKVPA